MLVKRQGLGPIVMTKTPLSFELQDSDDDPDNQG